MTTEDTREQVYDNRINPIMAEIIKICEENNIPFVASFQLTTEDNPLLCTSCSLPEGSAHSFVKARDALYQQPQPFWAFTITTKKEEK